MIGKGSGEFQKETVCKGGSGRKTEDAERGLDPTIGNTGLRTNPL